MVTERQCRHKMDRRFTSVSSSSRSSMPSSADRQSRFSASQGVKSCASCCHASLTSARSSLPRSNGPTSYDRTLESVQLGS